MTHAQIDAVFAKLEMKRNELFDKLASYNTDALNRKPDAESWSVIQVIEHLFVIERSIIAYIKKKSLDKASLQKTGLKEWGRSLMLNLYLRSSKKFPAPIAVMPAIQYASLNEMRELWNAERHEMKEAINAMPADMLSHNWFKHPAVGKLNLMQMFSFLEAHYDRHVRQIWHTIKEIA